MKETYFIECTLQYLESVKDTNTKRELLNYYLGIDANKNSSYLVNVLYKNMLGWFSCLK